MRFGVCNWGVKLVAIHIYTFGVKNFQRCTNPEGLKYE